MGKKLIVGSILTLVLAYYFSRSGTRKLDQVVETKNGKLQGIISLSRDGREFYEWLGVPYAKPPVGELRVRDQQTGGMQLERSTRYGPKCAQLEIFTNRPIGDEDCLYLNIHVPKIGKNDELPHGLPVMIYIHGGGFNSMSADDYRPEYFMDEDVILVVINYRLGSFGFFSTGDTVARGNMGLKDQALAIKWVNENIKAFGGDPTRVTIFGESAGGASTHYQMLSPSSRGLFSKVISQSGVATSTFALDSSEVAQRLSQDFAESLGCKDKDTLKMVNCLRALSAEELLRVAIPAMRDSSLVKPHMKGHSFRPTIEVVNDDEAFIAEHPYRIVKEGKAHRVPWLTGVTADEGLLGSLEFYRDERSMAAFEAEWESGIARMFTIPENHKRLPEIAEKLRQFYFPNASQLTTEERIAQYTRMLSDSTFFLPMSHTAEMQRKYSPVYLYHYNHHGGSTIANLIVGLKEKFPLYIEILLIIAKIKLNYYIFGKKPKDYGVCHGDEIGMLFHVPGMMNIQKDDPMYPFSKEMVKFWTDFAKTEKNLSFRGVSLEQVKLEGSLDYLELSENPKAIQEPFEDRIKFLKQLLAGVTIS